MATMAIPGRIPARGVVGVSGDSGFMAGISLSPGEAKALTQRARRFKSEDEGKLQGVEVGEKVFEVGGIGVRRGGHEVVAVEDGSGDTIIVGGSAAGQVRLFVEAEKRRAVQRAGLAIVVALRAVGLEVLVAERLLGCELRKRRGWRCAVTAGEKQT